MPPVTTPFATSAPDRRPGSDRRHARRAAPEPSSAEQRAWRIAPGAAFAAVRAGRKGHDLRAIGGGARRARPERYAQRFGPDLTKPTAWAERAPLRSQRSFVQPGLIEPGVFGLLGGAENPPESDRQSTPDASVMH